MNPATAVASLAIAEPRPNVPRPPGATKRSAGPGQAGYVSGGSVVSFVAGLSADEQRDVLDSTLLAQFAANAAADRERDLPRWYGKYAAVLPTVAWTIRSLKFQPYQAQGSTVSIGRVARQLLAGAAPPPDVTLMQQTIDAVTGNADDRYPLALFDHSAALTSGGSFQLQATRSADGVITMVLAALYFNTTAPTASILTAKLPVASTTIETAVRIGTLDREAYANVRQSVQNKLGAYASSYVAGVDL